MQSRFYFRSQHPKKFALRPCQITEIGANVEQMHAEQIEAEEAEATDEARKDRPNRRVAAMFADSRFRHSHLDFPGSHSEKVCLLARFGGGVLGFCEHELLAVSLFSAFCCVYEVAKELSSMIGDLTSWVYATPELMNVVAATWLDLHVARSVGGLVRMF